MVKEGGRWPSIFNSVSDTQRLLQSAIKLFPADVLNSAGRDTALGLVGLAIPPPTPTAAAAAAEQTAVRLTQHLQLRGSCVTAAGRPTYQPRGP